MPALQGMKTTTHKHVRLKGAGIPSGLHMGLGLFPVVALRLPPEWVRNNLRTSNWRLSRQ
jgi:hypothetical protein